MSKKAALYARVSTNEQDENLQIKTLIEIAKNRNYDYITYKDKVSGRDLNRPSWARLIKDVQNGIIHTIIVTSLDRISRSIIDLQSTIKELENYNVTLEVLNMGVLNPNDPNSRLAINLAGVFAEWEKDIISQRTKQALKEKKKQGVKLGRPPRNIPYHKIALLRINGTKWDEIAKIVNIPRTTLRNAKNKPIIDKEILDIRVKKNSKYY